MRGIPKRSMLSLKDYSVVKQLNICKNRLGATLPESNC